MPRIPGTDARRSRSLAVPARLGVAFLFAALLAAGCKKHPKPGAAAGSATASASAAPAGPPAPRCAAVKRGASFTIGQPGKSDLGDDDNAVALPFAVDLGSAVPLASGFAVSALQSVDGGTGAVIAIVGPDADSGKLVDLGRVYGDADPPRLAARDGHLVVAMAGNDASGATLRLVEIKNPGTSADVVWGRDMEQGNDQSQVFGVELGKKRGVLVWDDWDKSGDHGIIRGSTFALDDVSNATRSRVLSPKDDDAEAPRIVRRPGGFWLAWISHAREHDKHARAPKPAVKTAPAASSSDEPGAGDSIVELGSRWLELTPLDENGSPTAPPIAVTQRDAHVLVFDVAPARDGGALLAWRDDEAAPGAEGRIVHLAHVRPGGSVETQVLDDEKVGAGVPTLLVDLHPPDKPGPQAAWLSLAGVSDETRLAALDGSARLIDRLSTDRVLRHAEPVVLDRGRMLLATPRGLALELSTATCRVQKSAPRPAASGN